MPVDPQIGALLERVNEMPPMSAGTVGDARRAFHGLSLLAASTASPVEVGEVGELTVSGAQGDLPARLYRPRAAALDGRSPTLVFFHGGGFVIGSVATHDAQCRLLCELAGAAVLSVEYRLAPEHPFPAAAEDAIAAGAWALDNVERLGRDVDRMALGGDSAGGNLTAVVAQALRGRSPGYVAQLLLYPVTDFSDTARPSQIENADGYFLTRDDMVWFRGHYVGEGPPDDPRLSPLLADDLSGLPPAIVVTAELDPLRDDGEAYAEALEAAGVEVIRRRYDGLVHGFFAMGAFSRAAARAVEEICTDLRKLLASGGAEP
jgi:acetyl esterase/lipase